MACFPIYASFSDSGLLLLLMMMMMTELRKLLVNDQMKDDIRQQIIAINQFFF